MNQTIHVSGVGDSIAGKGFSIVINRKVVKDRELVPETEDTKPYWQYSDRIVSEGDAFSVTFGEDEKLEDGLARFANTISVSSKSALGGYIASAVGPALHIHTERHITIQAQSDTLHVDVVASR